MVGLERFVPFQRIFNRGYEQPLSRPEHVRRALEELGPTFIKLGQIVSMCLLSGIVGGFFGREQLARDYKP